MKSYEAPIIKITELSQECILTSSPGSGYPGGDNETPVAPWFLNDVE